MASTLMRDIRLGIILGLLAFAAILAWAVLMPAHAPEGTNPCDRATYDPQECSDVIEWTP